MEELNKNENITVKEQRDRKYALMNERKAKLMSILTPDQQAKLKQLREERQEKMGEKRLEKMKAKLNLSDDQVNQIKALWKDGKAQMNALNENQNISRTDKDEQRKTIWKSGKEKIEKILTPEQLKLFKEKHEGRESKPME